MPHSSFRHKSAGLFFAVLCVVVTTISHAQNSPGPQPVPMTQPIVAPADTPYPGTISLAVDITNVNDRVLNVHETIPIKGHELRCSIQNGFPGRIRHRTRSANLPVLSSRGMANASRGSVTG